MRMQYRDEELLRLRQKVQAVQQAEQQNAQAEQSIWQDQSLIDGHTVVFEQRQLMDSRLLMRVPQGLQSLSAEEIEQRFLLATRPQYVYEMEQPAFGITFTCTQTAAGEAQIEQAFPYMVKLVSRAGPGVRVLASGRARVNGLFVRWFDAIAQTLTEPAYRSVFVMGNQGQMVIGAMTCPSRLKKSWQPLMEQMKETLTELPVEGGQSNG